MKGNSRTSITQLSVNVLEAFISDYSIISKFLLDVLDFDITIVVFINLLIFELLTSLKFLDQHAYAVFEKYFTCFISIDSDDDIYYHIMKWLEDHKIFINSRSLMIKTEQEHAWDFHDLNTTANELNSNTLINFSNWNFKVSSKFQPYFDRHIFFHQDRYFEFRCFIKQMMRDSDFREAESIRLTCIEHSSQSIKNLMKNCRNHYLNKKIALIVVCRSISKENREEHNMWQKVATRSSKSMHTIVLNHDEKTQVLKNINEYLHSVTLRWYVARDISYRREYLFHKVSIILFQRSLNVFYSCWRFQKLSETDKFSFAWVIADVFDLDIYCISFANRTFTEEHLRIMFSSLSWRCVVLLEDINSVDLIKRQEEDEKSVKPVDDVIAKIDVELSKVLKNASKNNEKGKKNKKISLSDLLNAIDDVTSHEERVLVMTINCFEKLDEALIQSDRIDIKVEFIMITRFQIFELFTCMYFLDDSSSRLIATFSKETFEQQQQQQQQQQEEVKDFLAQKSVILQFCVNKLTFINFLILAKSVSDLVIVTPFNSSFLSAAVTLASMKLKNMTKDFAIKLSKNMLTSVEIQRYFLTRKKNLRRALTKMNEWRNRLIETKKSRSKLTSAQ